MIEYAGALSIYAEVSAALAGFVGIITVFGRRWEQGEWNPTEKRMLAVMLLVLFTNLGAALLPLSLVGATDDVTLVWRGANGFLGLSHIALLAWSVPALRGAASIGLSLSWAVPLLFLGLATHGACIAVALGLLVTYAPFALLWGLWFGLFVVAFLFVTLLFSSGRSRSEGAG